MRKNPARESLLVAALLGMLSSAPSAFCQNPATGDPAQAHILSLGSYYALVIGINNYQRITPKLQTPVNDARALAKVLKEQYGFNEVIVLLNGDATRKGIFEALTEFQGRLPLDSHLLIFYAGHGYHDRGTDAAYWLPVDAQPDNRERWISANDITGNIRAMLSKHILIISDSCYSGALTREANAAADPLKREAYLSYLAKMVMPKSRNLMASGGDEPVADSGAAGHSVFANAVLKGLTEMKEDQFTASDLFNDFIKRTVAGNSDQVPQYNSIRYSGDEDGDFVFSRGRKAVLVRPADDSIPSRTYTSSYLPEIACKKELTGPSLGRKIQEGDFVRCELLDQPLKWRTTYRIPEIEGISGKTNWTVTIDEDGWVIDIKPRGSTSPQGIISALKAAVRSWQTSPPTYQGKRVKSSFAIDIDFLQ